MFAPVEIEIRTATASDAPAILECLAAAFEPYRHEYTAAAFADTVLDPRTMLLRLKQMHVLVALSERNVVGTVAGAWKAEEGHLRGMAVSPEWRGAGVAQRLLAAIEGFLRSHGCRRITLDTTLPLQAAIRFYERSGYCRSGNVSDFFGMPLFEFVKNL